MFRPATNRPARSGWTASTPLSTTATTAASEPVVTSQADGTPIVVRYEDCDPEYPGSFGTPAGHRSTAPGWSRGGEAEDAVPLIASAPTSPAHMSAPARRRMA